MLSFVTTSLVNNDLKHKKNIFLNYSLIIFISRIDKLSLFSFFNKCFLLPFIFSFRI